MRGMHSTACMRFIRYGSREGGCVQAARAPHRGPPCLSFYNEPRAPTLAITRDFDRALGHLGPPFHSPSRARRLRACRPAGGRDSDASRPPCHWIVASSNGVGLSIMGWYPLTEETHTAGEPRGFACALFHALRVPAATRLAGQSPPRDVVARDPAATE